MKINLIRFLCHRRCLAFKAPAFSLLPQELLKHSTDCEGASELQGALTAMLDLLKSVNDSMHQIAITGYEVLAVSKLLGVAVKLMKSFVNFVNVRLLHPAGRPLRVGPRADAGLLQRVDQPQEGPDPHEGAGSLQAHAAPPLPVREGPAAVQAQGGARRRLRQDAVLQLQTLFEGRCRVCVFSGRKPPLDPSGRKVQGGF